MRILLRPLATVVARAWAIAIVVVFAMDSPSLGATTVSERSIATEPMNVTSRIRALESLGRAQPLEAAQQLEALRASMLPSSAQRLELLTVLGLTLAEASKADAADEPAAQLRARSKDPHPPARRARPQRRC